MSQKGGRGSVHHPQKPPRPRRVPPAARRVSVVNGWGGPARGRAGPRARQAMGPSCCHGQGARVGPQPRRHWRLVAGRWTARAPGGGEQKRARKGAKGQPPAGSAARESRRLACASARWCEAAGRRMARPATDQTDMLELVPPAAPIRRGPALTFGEAGERPPHHADSRQAGLAHGSLRATDARCSKDSATAGASLKAGRNVFCAAPHTTAPQRRRKGPGSRRCPTERCCPSAGRARSARKPARPAGGRQSYSRGAWIALRCAALRVHAEGCQGRGANGWRRCGPAQDS